MAYKKTPPPVPPRTTSKPFISVTVQSSTESAQDTYLDSQDHKSEVTSQSGLSNSSDSLDSSTRPPSVTRGGVTPAPEAPEPPPKHAALKSEQGTLTSSESHPEAIPKRKLSSIGIQVGVPFTLLCPQPTPCTSLRVITSGGGPLGLRGKVVCLFWGVGLKWPNQIPPIVMLSLHLSTCIAACSCGHVSPLLQWVVPVNVVTLSQPSPVHCSPVHCLSVHSTLCPASRRVGGGTGLTVL